MTHISRANCSEITRDRPGHLRTIFSALNLDFNAQSRNPLCSRILHMMSASERGVFSKCALSACQTVAEARYQLCSLMIVACYDW